ncbi:MAG: response regulator transcription factor [Actinomycetota bacterium]|nr:response regulator transcription factor [Actinomycetota bacterium]
MGERLRVVIAEDNYLLREGMRRLLEESPEVEVVAAVATADELLDAAARLRPDAVITDIRMPPTHGKEGIEAAHLIGSRHRGVGVVVLSQYASPLYAFELFKNGTAGLAYLLKDRVGDLQELLRALHEVVAGGSVIDPKVVEGILAGGRTAPDSTLGQLTRRELEVLNEMAQGKSNAGIARALFLSESAIEKHVNSIFAKLGIGKEPETHRRVAAVLAFLSQPGVGWP